MGIKIEFEFEFPVNSVKLGTALGSYRVGNELLPDALGMVLGSDLVYKGLSLVSVVASVMMIMVNEFPKFAGISAAACVVFVALGSC